MKKSHKIIVALVFIITVLLIIFLSKDFIIRKYFISILENVNYDEYILELSIDGKKNTIYYYTPEYVMKRIFDDNEVLENCIIIDNFIENSQYYYYFENNETIQNIAEFDFNNSSNLNNNTLLNFLNKTNESDKKSFEYKGIKNFNNIECHILEFQDSQNVITTIYLNKELLYTMKIDTYNSYINKHVIQEYTLDLNLDKKELFKIQ